MSEKKSFSFSGFLIAFAFIILGSFVGGVVLNMVMGDGTFSLTSKTTTSWAIIIFAVLFLFYILSLSGKDKSVSLKGKSSMENQHFASMKELNKNFTNCWFSELKNLSITGIPFRFEYKRRNLHMIYTTTGLFFSTKPMVGVFNVK